MSEEEARLFIEMLGGFSILADGVQISEPGKSSSKTWKLIQFLVANRHKSISRDELIETFCDSEYADNPGGTLRTLVYRARAALADGGLSCADEIIVAKHGGYAWNSNTNCDVDAEMFEAFCTKAGARFDDNEKLELLLRAAELYKGDFLPNSSGELWVMSLARWYRAMYINCALDALGLLTKGGRSAEAEELCTKALRTDPFDEDLLRYHLRSLIAQGKNAEALEEYKRMEAMYFDVLGVSFSDSLRALYAEIQRPDIKEAAPLEAVLEEWLEGAEAPGAFYCDLSVFKAMYQIESRSVPRSGRTAYIVRFDTRHDPKAKGGGIMQQLGMMIPRTLRMGDLFTRSSPSQYMIMLHSLTYEDCKMLIDRIIQALDSKYLSKLIGASVRPVRPMADS